MQQPPTTQCSHTNSTAKLNNTYLVHFLVEVVGQVRGERWEGGPCSSLVLVCLWVMFADDRSLPCSQLQQRRLIAPHTNNTSLACDFEVGVPLCSEFAGARGEHFLERSFLIATLADLAVQGGRFMRAAAFFCVCQKNKVFFLQSKQNHTTLRPDAAQKKPNKQGDWSAPSRVEQPLKLNLARVERAVLQMARVIRGAAASAGLSRAPTPAFAVSKVITLCRVRPGRAGRFEQQAGAEHPRGVCVLCVALIARVQRAPVQCAHAPTEEANADVPHCDILWLRLWSRREKGGGCVARNAILLLTNVHRAHTPTAPPWQPARHQQQRRPPGRPPRRARQPWRAASR
jgi:hypothetical protein